MSARPIHADNSPVELLFTDPLRFATPGDRCEAPICVRLLELIQGAQSSIDFAVYGMRNQTQLLEALVAAQARGVVVRGVVDRNRDRENYYTSTDLWVSQLKNIRDDFDAETILDQRSAWKPRRPSCPRPEGFKGPLQCLAYDLGDRWLVAAHASREPFDESTTNRIMHNKFFIVDGRWVWTGSCNLSDSGTGGYNANVATVIGSTQLADVYTEEFEQMWAGRYHQLKTSDGVERLELNGTQVEVWFSPQDKAMRKGVQTLIAGARQRIDLAVFYLTNKFVTAELIAAHGRGVDIRVIVDATSARNEYSKHELLRTAGHSCQGRELGRQDAHEGCGHRRTCGCGRVDELDRGWRIRERREYARAQVTPTDCNLRVLFRAPVGQHPRGVGQRPVASRPRVRCLIDCLLRRHRQRLRQAHRQQ